MGEAEKVRMGVCNAVFKGEDLGYTAGGVKVDYSAETVEKTVDQEDAPIDEVVIKQSLEVIVPLAERDLERLSALMPGATYVTDEIDVAAVKLVLSGAAGTSLQSLAGPLVLTPVNSSDDNDKLTLYHAAPTPKVSFAYEKENIRVFEVTFKALVGDDGWVAFGDTCVLEILSLDVTSGSVAGGSAVIITGSGFTDNSASVTFDGDDATSVVVVDGQTINCETPAGLAGAVDVVVTIDGYQATLADGFMYTS